MEALSSASPKRVRAFGHGTQVPSCSVDGCCSDLRKCKDYHRRHKVCEFHSKAPKVVIAGEEKRFCQQCSRFHSLAEFDGGKRSCRRRLDGHNKRRRKPQPASLYTNAERFRLVPSYQGTCLSPLTVPQTFSSDILCTAPAGIVEAKNEEIHCHGASGKNFCAGQDSFFLSLSRIYKRQVQLPFLQGTSPTLPGVSSAQSVHTNPTSGIGYSSLKYISHQLSRNIDGGHARSLLSLPQAESKEISPGNVFQKIEHTAHSVPSSVYSGLRIEGILGHPPSVPNASGNSDLHRQGACIGADTPNAG